MQCEILAIFSLHVFCKIVNLKENDKTMLKSLNPSFSAIIRKTQGLTYLTQPTSIEEWARIKNDMDKFSEEHKGEKNPHIEEFHDMYIYHDNRDEKTFTDSKDVAFLNTLLKLNNFHKRGVGDNKGTISLDFEIDDDETLAQSSYKSPTLGNVDDYTSKSIGLSFNENSPVFELSLRTQKGSIYKSKRYNEDVCRLNESSSYEIPVTKLSDQAYGLFSQLLLKFTEGECSLPERKTPRLPKADS